MPAEPLQVTDPSTISAAPAASTAHIQPESTPDLSASLSKGLNDANSTPNAAASPVTPPNETPTPAGPTGTPTPAQAFSVREHLRTQGYDPSVFQDDASALSALLDGFKTQQTRLQELQQLAQVGQRVLPHISEFEKFQLQQQQAQKQPVEKEPWYKPPEYDPRWESLLAVDEKGQIVPKPGTPGTAETVAKYLKWQEHSRDFQTKFAQDPIGTIKPGIEELVEKMVEDRIKQNLGGYQDKIFVQQVVAQDSSWIHVKDQSGRIIGFTPAGQSFVQEVARLEQSGIKDVRQQHQLAKQKVEYDLMKQHFMAQQNQVKNQQMKSDVVQNTGTNRVANLQASLAPPNLNGSEPSQNTEMNLLQRLRQDLSQNGITSEQMLSGVA